jgi:Asp-tRNA(Asn)/Glu-tRNA(Gln) amidotransferase A subunit family amidase
MLTRRRALAILGAAGIGTGVFQRALAAKAAELRSRKISSVELTKLYLARLRRYDPLLKCVVTFMDEVALHQAKRADSELNESN